MSNEGTITAAPNSSRPDTVSAPAMLSRSTDDRRSSAASDTGCRAANGATRIARDAGAYAAKAVNATPPTPVKTSGNHGRTGPATSNPVTAAPAKPIPMPTTTPITDPTAPTSPASANTSRRTWPRLPPMHRVNAICRRRWVSRMVKVLAITMPEAATAVIANPSRTIVNTVAPPVISARFLAI